MHPKGGDAPPLLPLVPGREISLPLLPPMSGMPLHAQAYLGPARNCFATRAFWLCRSERELAAIKVAKEDVAILASEFDLDARAADRLLREQGGSLEAAIRHQLSGALPALAAKVEERNRGGKKPIFV